MMRIERGFFQVEGREVHYRRTGSGPPALFIHSSPANSSFVVDDMRAQAANYTCFAFDTPGFGLSDPLSGDVLTMSDLARATAAAIDALDIGPLPVYGSHTGAAIALELGYRYPEKVTGLFLDGVPIFTREEVAPLGDNYFAPLVVDILGGHFSAAWTRFRDQNIWFPWCFRTAENLNEYDLPDPENIHRWMEMFFAAAPHYRAAYPVAVRYCEAAIAAAAGLSVPAIFTASATDMLYPHLERLPNLRHDQAIVEFGTDLALKYRLTGEAFARFGSPRHAPAAQPPVESSGKIRRRFVRDGDRMHMIRHAGDIDAPMTLLLHDVPGSSHALKSRIRTLAASGFVIAPDLPGSGESLPLAQEAEMADYADAIWRLCDHLGVNDIAIEAYGFAASLAVEMAAMRPARSLTIDGLLLPDHAERAELFDRYAPPIAIERDGAHWYRTWLMLRDSLVYWPWYDTRKAALRREPIMIDAQALHDRTVETMKQRTSYHRFIEAALRHDAAARVVERSITIERAQPARSPLAKAYGERLAELLAS